MIAAFGIAFESLEIGHGGQRLAGPLSGHWHSRAVWALTGPNGSGKTTLLRTLIGLLPAIAGRIEGREGHRISYVPQLGDLDTAFPLTCTEVVGSGLPLATPRRQRRERAERALVEVGLQELRRRPFANLSGGQRQRVLLARAFCAAADIVALDEPTAGVDAVASVEVWRIVRRLADNGCLVVVVTHDLFRAPEFADHVLALQDGHLSERERATP